MTEIKPCPKCGGKAELFITRDTRAPTNEYYVRCLDCHRRVGPYNTSEEAIVRWNEEENEEATPLTDGSSDRSVNNPTFCCKGLFKLIVHNRKNICTFNGKFLAIRGEDGWDTPIKYCPSCGKEIRLTFLADSEVDG